MKKIIPVILSVVFILLAGACFMYQASIDKVSESDPTLRALTYYGLPGCAVLAVIFAVIAVVAWKRNK